MTSFKQQSLTSGALGTRTVHALRSALRQSLRDGNHGAELHDLLCRAAGEARAAGMPPEQLLKEVKAIWHSLPETPGAMGSEAPPRLLQDLVSRCIQEYYGA
jgi:hypothetical protein